MDQITAPQWWAGQRLKYNIGLIIAAFTALFSLNYVVYKMWAPIAAQPSAIELNLLDYIVMFAGFITLMVMGNFCYYLGPLSEKLFKPMNPVAYRKWSFNSGFVFSMFVPFSYPIYLAIAIIRNP